ncbi:MAG: HEAT repeat domain-containing protein [Planctomycetota bacterium]
MSFGLSRTLEVLAASENLAANDLLVEIVFHGEPEQASSALEFVLAKRYPEALFRLVAGYHLLSEASRKKLLTIGNRLSNSIRRAYLDVSETIYANGCDLIRQLPDFDQAPLLLGSFSKDTTRKQDAEQILFHLILELLRQMELPSNERPYHDIEGARQRMLATLRDAMRRYTLYHSEVIPEGFLLLADEDAPEVPRILREGRDLCHRPMVIIFRRRNHPRILRWIFPLLNNRHPPGVILALISERDDDPFIHHLLDNIGQLAEPFIANAFRKITEVRWLRPDHRIWHNLSESRKTNAVILLTQSGLPIERKLEVLAFFLDEGEPSARRAAACALAQLPGADANNMVRACMDDDDPEVQLAATQQIRERGITNALAMLLKKLDHSDARIREAAHEALSDYTMERYIGVFEQLDDSTRKTMGSMILKIDKQSRQALLAQLHSQQRRLQMRAARIVRALGIGDDYVSELLVLLADKDHLVRREMIETLAHLQDPTFVQRLVEMTSSQEAQTQHGAYEAIDRLRRAASAPAVRDALHVAAANLGMTSI